MAKENGKAPEQQDQREVLDRVQRDFGIRARLLATKPSSPLLTDETLVYQAVEHALRTGTPTVVLTRDPDVEEQIFKLLWLLNSHHRAMLCADAYLRDFGGYRTLPVPGKHASTPSWPIEPAGSVLVDFDRWGPNLDGVLPRSCRFLPISCWHVGDLASQITFGGEREMARLLDVKDRARGKSSDRLGARNLHAGAPDFMLPPNDDRSCVLIARDRADLATRSGAPLARLDVMQAVASAELPRHVELVTQNVSSHYRLSGRRHTSTVVTQRL